MENNKIPSEYNVSNFYKQNYDIDDNIIYKYNNFQIGFISFNYNLKLLKECGGAIWLDIRGDINYRTSIEGKVYKSSMKKISLVLSKILNKYIEIKYHEIKKDKEEYTEHCQNYTKFKKLKEESKYLQKQGLTDGGFILESFDLEKYPYIFIKNL